METFIKTTLVIHAISGGIALISGLIAIFTKKGKGVHSIAGLVYFWSMLTVVISGLIVGAARGNIFLQTIAVFSFYMVFTGRRVLAFKKAVTPKWSDWLFVSVSGITALAMLVLGLFNLSSVVAPMLLVFGGLLLWMVIEDSKIYWKKELSRGQWLLKHISKMGGSYIATSTAFLLVNTNVEPVWVMWLAPTVVGTPMIAIASNKWRKKMKI